MSHEHEEANPACVCSCDCKVAHGEHDLRLCPTCDTAYCTACKKEWGVNSTYTPYATITTSSDHVDGVWYIPPACSHA